MLGPIFWLLQFQIICHTNYIYIYIQTEAGSIIAGLSCTSSTQNMLIGILLRVQQTGESALERSPKVVLRVAYRELWRRSLC